MVLILVLVEVDLREFFGENGKPFALAVLILVLVEVDLREF